MLLFFVVVFWGWGVLFLFFGTKPGDLPYVVYIYIYIYIYIFFFVVVVLVGIPIYDFFFILFILYFLIGGHMGSSLRKNLLVDLKEQFP